MSATNHNERTIGVACAEDDASSSKSLLCGGGGGATLAILSLRISNSTIEFMRLSVSSGGGGPTDDRGSAFDPLPEVQRATTVSRR